MGRQKRRQRKVLMLKAQEHGRPRCSYCGVAITRKLPPAAGVVTINGEDVAPFTIDHVIPRAAGGANAVQNYLPACEPCNVSRADVPLDQFIASMGERAVMLLDDAKARMVDAREACEQAHSRRRKW